MAQAPSSRKRFGDYREHVRQRRRGAADDADASAKIPTGKTRSTKRSRSFADLFRAFLGLLRGHRMTLVLALLTAALATLFSLIPPYGTKLVADNVVDGMPLPAPLAPWLPGTPRYLLIAVVVGMVGMALFSLLLGMWARWQATRTTQRVKVSVRRKVFDHAVRLPLHRVYQMKSGGVASILREDAGGVGDLVFAMLYNPWQAVVRLVGTLIILAVVDWRLLLGSLLILPLVFLTHRTWINRIRPMYRDIRASRQGIDARATEAFGGMRIVRGFARQRSEAAVFTTGGHFMARQELHTWWWARGIDIAWSIIIPVATAGLMLYGGYRILGDRELVAAGLLTPDKAMTLGDLIMFVAYLGGLLHPLATLAASATGLQNNLAGLDRVLDLLNEDREMPASADTVTPDPNRVQGHIELQGVTFTYPGGTEPAVQGVTLDAKPGQTVAFVGPSGAGKTTLCNLIARFYDPTAGRITLDGRDLRDLDVDAYRSLLGIVEQDIFLFDGTIAENIGYARRGVSHDAIEHAAELANAHGFIAELPHGYDTLIGERGVRLSGGQRQRLAIARALLAEPRILILDEATSSLDTESERLIQASLHDLMQDRTSFVIAHRLSTVTGADLIVVLENGRVIEQGHHDELMERSGRYRTMIDMQLANPEREPVAVVE